MTHQEIREKFIKFFEEKGHKLVPSSSLLPTDPSVLFTTAGMQQFKPYYTGEANPMKDFGSLNAVSVQKCLRTSDIEQVGDNSHLTFLEMLGNFSFGGYFKEEAIKYAHEFITKELGLKIDYVSVFAGEGNIPADEESEKIWKSISPDIVVKRAGRADNFWGPTGSEGPCGPTTEIYINDIEVWNIVFNEFFSDKDGTLLPLVKKGIDTGMGLERLVMMVQNKKNVFETDLFEPLISVLPTADTDKKRKRIIADHARASFFLISDGVRPSNKEQGYVLRRLIRRMIIQAHLETFGSFSGTDTLSLGIPEDTKRMFDKIYQNYSNFYPELNLNIVNEVFDKEFNQFNKTFRQGLEEIKFNNTITAPVAFNLYGTFGITFEIIKDVGGEKAKNLTREAFDAEFKKHQELSRTASAGMFKGGLADENPETIRLHTAAHLMLEALRRVLGGHIQQKGSNITSERLRFDFSHNEKMTLEQIKMVEDLVNEQIRKNLSVHFEEMSVDEAKKLGATGVFEHKYGDKVKVYFVGNDNDYFSKEICGGPHVVHTGEIGKFKIIKEESVSAGTRRIRATVE